VAKIKQEIEETDGPDPATIAALDRDRIQYVKPPGAFDVRWYADRYKISWQQAETAIARLVDAGKAQVCGKFGNRKAKHFVLIEK
jgi:hypothetical protein